MNPLFRLLAIGLLLSPSTSLAVPQLLTHQGRVTLADNEPLTGSEDIQFSLYTAATGGSAIWSETLTITFDDGFYSVALGADSNNPIVDELDGGNHYLGIQIAGSNEFVPRHPITSVPYAIKAGSAVSADSVTGPVNAQDGLQVNNTEVIDSDGTWVGTISTNSFETYLSDNNYLSGNCTDDYLIKCTDTGALEDSALFEENGNVGVGTETPNEALTVNGIISVEAQSQSPSSTDGYGKLYFKNGAEGEPANLLLHFNGDLQDDSGHNHSVSHSGSSLGTTYYKFNSGQALNATGGNGGARASVAGHSDWNFGTGDYTIDLWIYWPDDLNNGSGGDYDDKIVDAGGNFRFGFKGCGGICMKMGGENLGSGSQTFWSSNFDVTSGEWHHLAWVRSGSTAYAFFDGVLKMEQAANYALDGSGGFAIGATPGGGERSAVWIDEFRIATGTAYWTSDFSDNLPTGPHSSSDASEPGLFFMDNEGNEFSVSLTPVE